MTKDKFKTEAKLFVYALAHEDLDNPDKVIDKLNEILYEAYSKGYQSARRRFANTSNYTMRDV